MCVEIMGRMKKKGFFVCEKKVHFISVKKGWDEICLHLHTNCLLFVGVCVEMTIDNQQ